MAKALAALILGLCFALSASAATSGKKQPEWSQLTPEQQQILAPLASDWNALDQRPRKKWLLLAKRYPKMKPEQQQRLQTQMRDWAKLTPEQPHTARENYKKRAKQPPEKREAVTKKGQEQQQSRLPRKCPPPPVLFSARLTPHRPRHPPARRADASGAGADVTGSANSRHQAAAQKKYLSNARHRRRPGKRRSCCLNDRY